MKVSATPRQGSVATSVPVSLAASSKESTSTIKKITIPSQGSVSTSVPVSLAASSKESTSTIKKITIPSQGSVSTSVPVFSATSKESAPTIRKCATLSQSRLSSVPVFSATSKESAPTIRKCATLSQSRLSSVPVFSATSKESAPSIRKCATLSQSRLSSVPVSLARSNENASTIRKGGTPRQISSTVANKSVNPSNTNSSANTPNSDASSNIRRSSITVNKSVKPSSTNSSANASNTNVLSKENGFAVRKSATPSQSRLSSAQVSSATSKESAQTIRKIAIPKQSSFTAIKKSVNPSTTNLSASTPNSDASSNILRSSITVNKSVKPSSTNSSTNTSSTNVIPIEKLRAMYANIPDDDDDDADADADDDASDDTSDDGSKSNQMQLDASKSEGEDDDDEFEAAEELDDETTLIQAEQEDDNDKAEEIALPQQEQDIPIEKLRAMYANIPDDDDDDADADDDASDDASDDGSKSNQMQLVSKESASTIKNSATPSQSRLSSAQVSSATSKESAQTIRKVATPKQSSFTAIKKSVNPSTTNLSASTPNPDTPSNITLPTETDIQAGGSSANGSSEDAVTVKLLAEKGTKKQKEIDNSKELRMLSAQCSLCLEEKPMSSLRHNLCSYKHISTDSDSNTETSVCQECIISYISTKITSSAIGSCQPIYCPLIHADALDGKPVRRIIPYKRWCKLVDSQVLAAHEKLCQSVLSFRCCNPVSSAYAIATPSRESLVVTKRDKDSVAQLLPPDSTLFNALKKRINEFEVNEVSADVFFADITDKYFPPQFNDVKDERNSGKWMVMMCVLRLIGDPERRASLQLRYYNRFPRFTATICCTSEHCFKCKSNWHHGKNCTIFSSGFNNNVVVCPSCLLHLTRSEGCDHVVCICGYSMNWSRELEVTQDISQFLAAHGDNALQACVDSLTTESSQFATTSLRRARSWQQRHQNEVNVALLKWWQRKYDSSYAASVCASILDRKLRDVNGNYINPIPQGVTDAANLWHSAHGVEVQRFREQSVVAIRSLFPSLYPDVGRIQAFAALVVLGAGFFKRQNVFSSKDDADRLVQSAEHWMSHSNHKRKFDEELVLQEERFALNFIEEWDSFSHIFTWPTKEARVVGAEPVQPEGEQAKGSPAQASEEKSALDADVAWVRSNCADSLNLSLTVSTKELLGIYVTQLKRIWNKQGDDRASILEGADSYIKYCHKSNIDNPEQFLLVSLSSVIRDISLVSVERDSCYGGGRMTGYGQVPVGAYSSSTSTSLLLPSLQSIVLRSDVAAINALLVDPRDLFRLVYYGACYTCRHYDELSTKRTQLYCDGFIQQHGLENAPFVAAGILSAAHNVGIDNRQRYLADAFMKLNAESMNQWYDYNAQLQEPLFGLDKSCYCLPRHVGRCPNPKEGGRKQPSQSGGSVAAPVPVTTPKVAPTLTTAGKTVSSSSSTLPTSASQERARSGLSGGGGAVQAPKKPSKLMSAGAREKPVERQLKKAAIAEPPKRA